MTEVAEGRSRFDWLWTLAFLFLVPGVLHLTYSWIGFNPTDDGFILALGRRILEGEVPHRDFVFIRPAGSPILHSFWLVLAGDACLWWSRAFVWFQHATIAWIWVRLLADGSRLPGGKIALVSVALTALFLDSHDFTLMVWYTIDGMFFAALGILGLSRGTGAAILGGALALGLAPLCKQNFLLVGISALLLMGHGRSIRAWILFFLPTTSYLVTIGALGGLTDLLEQMGAQTGLYRYGIHPYLVSSSVSWGIVIGLALVHPCLDGGLVRRFSTRDITFPYFARILVLLTIGGLAASNATHVWGGLTIGDWSRLDFGILVGLVLGDLTREIREGPDRRLLILLLVTAWSASISLSQRYPALMSGCLLAGILLRCWAGAAGGQDRSRLGRVVHGAWILLLLGLPFLTGLQHHRLRWWTTFRELPADRLHSPLGDVLRGGDRILTNSRMFAMLSDLNQLVEKLKPETVAVLPDISAYWMRSAQPNPLPIEWPLDSEMPGLELSRKTSNDIYRMRGKVVFILQKEPAESIHLGPSEGWPDELYSIVFMVQSWMTKVGESEFFEVYR